MRKLPIKTSRYLFAFFMSLAMTLVMTCFITLVNTGWHGDFERRWLRAILFAWPLSFCCILLFADQIRRFVTYLTEPDCTD
jgi:hypothetical protein